MADSARSSAHIGERTVFHDERIAPPGSTESNEQRHSCSTCYSRRKIQARGPWQLPGSGYIQRVNPSANTTVTKSPRGMTAVGVFLFFGAVMAALAGTTMVWQGSALDRVWSLNPRAYRELVPFGKAVGIPLLLLAAILAVAGLGWFKRRRWGWMLAVALIATQVLGTWSIFGWRTILKVGQAW